MSDGDEACEGGGPVRIKRRTAHNEQATCEKDQEARRGRCEHIPGHAVADMQTPGAALGRPTLRLDHSCPLGAISEHGDSESTTQRHSHQSRHSLGTHPQVRTQSEKSSNSSSSKSHLAASGSASPPPKAARIMAKGSVARPELTSSPSAAPMSSSARAWRVRGGGRVVRGRGRRRRREP
jgi:hypothetical protein